MLRKKPVPRKKSKKVTPRTTKKTQPSVAVATKLKKRAVTRVSATARKARHVSSGDHAYARTNMPPASGMVKKISKKKRLKKPIKKVRSMMDWRRTTGTTTADDDGKKEKEEEDTDTDNEYPMWS